MTFKCCKCNKVQPVEERAAWDGKGHEACWACFGRFGWASFPEPVENPWFRQFNNTETGDK